MEHIVQSRPWLQPEPQRPARKLPVLPRLVLVVLAFAGASTLLVMGARALGEFAGARSVSLVSFADIFPGQPSTAIEARGSRLPDEDSSGYYTLQLADGPFSRVSLLAANGTIREAYATARENVLRAGDLMVLWGRPDVQEVGPVLYLYWHQPSVFALVSGPSERFTPLLPISKIALSTDLRSPLN